MPKENDFFQKLKMIFKIKQQDNATEEEEIKTKNKNTFIENVSFKENKEDVELIEKVKRDKKLMEKMKNEEMDNLNKAIKRRKIFLEKKVEKLKNEIAIKEFQLRRKN